MFRVPHSLDFAQGLPLMYPVAAQKRWVLMLILLTKIATLKAHAFFVFFFLVLFFH